VVVNGVESEWAEVLSGVPQGSVLGPVLFVCYINDLPEAVTTNVKLFADDTKLYVDTSKPGNSTRLQNDISALDDWALNWQLSFNTGKCKIMHIGNNNRKDKYYMLQDGVNRLLETSDLEKDIGVYVDDELKFDKHVEVQCNKANKMLGLIRRSFTYLDKDSMKTLYVSLIRPILEYGHVITYPRFSKSAVILENVQKRATSMIPELRDLEYKERLKILNLQSLYYRRDRGDMIECFKMTHGVYDIKPLLIIDYDNTRRGHPFKLKHQASKRDVRHKYFSLRVVANWNALPVDVVSAPSLNSFKSRLDSYWKEYMFTLEPLPPCKPVKTDMQLYK